VGPLAQRDRFVFVVEPLNRAETNIINSVDEGAEIVRAVAHPNVRLLADTFHMAREGEGPDAIRRAGDLLAHVHCAEKAERRPLGLGVGEDHRPYFKALKDIGYAGRVSIEAGWKDFPAELPAAVAELRKQIETAAN
jgi:sugar phosphate isomerase/epimerase